MKDKKRWEGVCWQ